MYYKKTLIALTVILGVMITSARAEILFQKTYTVAGMTASEIEQALGDHNSMKITDGIADYIGVSLGLIAGSDATNQESPIRCNWTGSSFYADTAIMVQAKDDKYTGTVEVVVGTH